MKREMEIREVRVKWRGRKEEEGDKKRRPHHEDMGAAIRPIRFGEDPTDQNLRLIRLNGFTNQE